MAIQTLHRKSDYLHPGSPNDPRLFHADSADQVQVWSPQVGQGYTQTIPLREGLSLVILDYTTHHTRLRYMSGLNQCLEYTFHIAGPTSGQSFSSPHLGEGEFGVWQSQQRQLKVEILFSAPNFMSHLQTLTEHLLPQDQAVLYDWANWVHRHRYGYAAPSPQATFAHILNGAIALPTPSTTEQLFEGLEFFAFSRPWRLMTPEMHQVVNQILSCPYGGRVRRTYLERKALELVALKLNALAQRRSLSYPLNSGDLDGVYQAAKILARNLNNPPSIEALARQVGLNRLKLNQGFHHVYGTTPFRYLRNCRLKLARYLLTISELAVEEIAYRVGYANRSRFATAFRQQFGLNPKNFQLQSNSVFQQQD